MLSLPRLHHHDHHLHHHDHASCEAPWPPPTLCFPAHQYRYTLSCTSNGASSASIEVVQDSTDSTILDHLDTQAIASLLQKRISLSFGKRLHALIVQRGLQNDPYICNLLISMYRKCSFVELARSVFDRMHQRTVVSWTAMIGAYSAIGSSMEAVQLFHQMQLQGVQPNQITFIAILGACSSPASLQDGRTIHARIAAGDVESDVAIDNSLVSMYGKCGALEDARSVFDTIPQRSVVSWNAMIRAYTQLGQMKEALQLYQQMQQAGVEPDKVTATNMLAVCESASDLSVAKELHASIENGGFESDVVVGTALLSMYDRCGALDKARSVFDKIDRPNVVSWTAMIGAYAHHGHVKEALHMFKKMKQVGVEPNYITLMNVVSACASLASLADVKAIHAIIGDDDSVSDVVKTALVNMYGRVGAVQDARTVFDKMHQHDVVSWTAIITAYCKSGQGKEALHLFHEMQREGVEPDQIAYISILGVFDSPAALTVGQVIHAGIVESGFLSNVCLGTALLKMYNECGNLHDGRTVFDIMQVHDVVSFNTMILAYSQHGYVEEALGLFGLIYQEGLEPDEVTFVNILSAFDSSATLQQGKAIHAIIVEYGFVGDVIMNALVTMYGKCGALEDARSVFDKIHERGLVSWTALISIYSQHGLKEEAFQLFRTMDQQGLKPDEVTFVSMLGVCTKPAALPEGKAIHVSIVKHGFEADLVVGSALINMYGKCGTVKDARWVFDMLHPCNTISFNAMITAFSHHGHSKEALQLFQEMCEVHVEPDEVTFLSLLSACSHAGLVEEGHRLFVSMTEEHKVAPTMEHYCCMVDLLGRVGHLEEAENLITKIPVQPDAVVWLTLLGACRTHKDVARGERAAKHVLDLDQSNAAAYVLLSNLYNEAGRWTDALEVRKTMVKRGVKKMPGCSWIDVDNETHEFFAADTLHPKSDAIYAEIDEVE